MILPGIQKYQDLPLIRGSLAGQEHREYPSLPSHRHFLLAHGDPLGQVDLH